jgi:hypothetical protein
LSLLCALLDIMIEDKYIGLALAMSSALAIGTSFVITKKGLIQAEERHGFEGDGFAYLKNPLWWAGIATRKYLTVSWSFRGLC